MADAIGRPMAPLNQQYLHKRDEMFTPLTPQVMKWLEELRTIHGSWEAVCDEARVSSRWLRSVRKGKHKTISLTNLDKLLTRCDSPHRAEDLEWYEFDGLLEKGVWKPMGDWRAGASLKWEREAKEFGQLPEGNNLA